MSEIVVVTNRLLCPDDFLSRIEKICEAKPKAIILREKDLPEEEYFLKASLVKKICDEHNVEFIVHSFVKVALKLEVKAIHLPLMKLQSLSEKDKRAFSLIGASCHSLSEAVRAEESGCGYVTAGHIYKTDCKRDLIPRGTEFLKEVVNGVSVPVYAIGGITEENLSRTIKTGAKGACVMSGAMTCTDPLSYITSLKKIAERAQNSHMG